MPPPWLTMLSSASLGVRAGRADAESRILRRPRESTHVGIGNSPAHSRKPADRYVYGGIALLAFVARLVPALVGGGLTSYGRYDDGVYYAAADSLTFGRLPYHDFVLLHPPGIMLVLAPFAALGRLTSDPTGMAVARLCFMAIGACNAVLVTKLAWRWGAATAIVSGVLYACWFPAIYGEETTLLEPLGTTALLIALLLLLKRRSAPTRRAELVAGVVLGLACALKIWYVAPWAAIVVWQLAIRRFRSAARIVAAGTAALTVVVLPFAVVGGARMYDMVVRDQLRRPPAPTNERITRLDSITGMKALFGSSHALTTVMTDVAVAVLVLAAIVCMADRFARVVVLVFTTNLLVLMLSPSYFGHYSQLTAAPGALVVGIGLARWPARMAAVRVTSPRVAVACLLFVAGGIRVMSVSKGEAFPDDQFQAAAPPGCVAADDPAGLIQMDRLSSDLRDGCTVPVDVSGVTYGTLPVRGGRQPARAHNGPWQRYLYDYLTSARSFVVLRLSRDQLSSPVVAALRSHPALIRTDHLVLRLGDAGPPTQPAMAGTDPDNSG